MKWETYRVDFYYHSIKKGYSKREIEGRLQYAKILFDKKLPIIYDTVHLSHLVGFKADYLFGISNATEKYYRVFSIPKKNGRIRSISEPFRSLKTIQYWIDEEILQKIKISPYAKAYIRNRSILDNARVHINRNIILKLDIENFFQSIKFKRVFSLFQGLGYTRPLSVLLANLCCLNNGLPQGAPTSPILSNILMYSFDKRVSGYLIPKGIYYTRYSDDLTFSGDFDPGKVINYISQVLQNYDLRLNHNKIRVMKPHQKQIVTGLIVNEKLQVPKSTRRYLRQEVYFIKKFGLESHLKYRNNNRSNHIKYLLGLNNFVLHVNPYDVEALEFKEFLKQLV